MSNVKYLLLSIICFLLGVAFVNVINNTKLLSKNSLGLKTQPTPTPKFCGDERYQETATQSEKEISQIVFGNKAAVKIAKDNCMWVFGAKKGRLIGTDEEDIVFWGSGVGCGSCHTQVVYVVSNGKVIFEEWFGDPKVEIERDKEGKDVLAIIEPLRREDEGLCCPSTGVRILYKWSDSSSTFVPFDSRPYKYELK